MLYLILKMLVLPFQVFNVAAVAAVFPPHEGDVFTGLGKNLGLDPVITKSIFNVSPSLGSEPCCICLPAWLAGWGWRPSVQ